MRISAFLLAAGWFCLTGVLTAGQTPAVARGASSDHPSESCELLATLQLPHVGIAMAKPVAAGAFVAPPQLYTAADLAEFFKKLPAFCRIVAHDRPTPDSDIVIEIWMPLEGWNGKLQGIGNGGFAGQIDYQELGAAVGKGYAAVATDTGHDGSPIDAAWALGHPEKVIDFGYRAIHEMTGLAKLVVQRFYATPPSHSYFASCSDGGREALMEAQRFPADYDGILAGAPANYWTAQLTVGAVDTQALTATPASFIPPAKIPTIARAVLAACDHLDGLSDGILNDPRQCHFDPASIECKHGKDSAACLTSAQVTALKKIYAGLRDAQGRQVFPGYLPGAEEGGNGWETWITGPAPDKSLLTFFSEGYFSDIVYGKADWNLKTFNWESGLQAADEETASALNAVNPDLSAFRARGGKLILYHGWDDPAIPALNTVNYYEGVEAKMGLAETDSFTRLYMVPGMQHCGEGPGPDNFGESWTWTASDPQHNVRIALEDWVETGAAPAAIIATKTAGSDGQGPAVMTRPLCPYPQAAKYKGSGDLNRAENFVCAAQ
ncbi:MAG: tannase/feruloyl esterase family alpha/beta hydrolase [Terracidiphilus sp.]